MNFYNNLPALNRPLKDVLANEKYFFELPPDWQVIVADITNSTEVIKEGRHTDVNLVAAGSLIAALNVAKTFNSEIPYFFGGDGGTVIVPGEIVDKVLEGLQAHRLNSLKHFSLDLRVGNIPVAEIKKAGYDLRIAKVAIGRWLNKSVVIGDGLKYAEQTIKQHYRPDEKRSKKDMKLFDVSALNLEGMECRWDTIKPPMKGLEVVCLLIEASDPKSQLTVYNNVLKKLEEIYGATEKRNPLSVQSLRLKNSFMKFQKAMWARYSKWKIGYLIKLFFQNIAGWFYFKYDLKVNDLKGGDYLKQVIQYADTLTIDGRINTIVSGTAANRIEFLNYLNKEEQKGTLLYGHYVSAESIMTCYIENLNNKHTHFVDGVGGGYTEASKELKPKFLKALL